MIYEKGAFCTVPTARLKDMDYFEQSLFLWFCLHSNNDGECYPSVAKLADETKMSRTKIFAVIASLEEKGIIQRSGILGRVNDYQIIVTSTPDERGGDRHADGGYSPRERGGDRHANTELNSDELNSRTKTSTKGAVDSQAYQPTPSDEAKEFFNSPSKQEAVIEQIIAKGYNPEIIRKEVSKFVSYWVELSKNGRRSRWELEKTFEVRRRLVTWLSRATGQPRAFQPKPSQTWKTI